MRSVMLVSAFAAYLFIVQGPLAEPIQIARGGFGEIIQVITALHHGGFGLFAPE